MTEITEKESLASTAHVGHDFERERIVVISWLGQI